MAITCTTICSCTNDYSLSLKETQTIDFSDKENLYIENLNKSNNVSTKEALDEILKKTNTFTRGNNDLKAVGILYKENITRSTSVNDFCNNIKISTNIHPFN